MADSSSRGGAPQSYERLVEDFTERIDDFTAELNILSELPRLHRSAKMDEMKPKLYALRSVLGKLTDEVACAATRAGDILQDEGGEDDDSEGEDERHPIVSNSVSSSGKSSESKASSAKTEVQACRNHLLEVERTWKSQLEVCAKEAVVTSSVPSSTTTSASSCSTSSSSTATSTAQRSSASGSGSGSGSGSKREGKQVLTDSSYLSTAESDPLTSASAAAAHSKRVRFGETPLEYVNEPHDFLPLLLGTDRDDLHSTYEDVTTVDRALAHSRRMIKLVHRNMVMNRILLVSCTVLAFVAVLIIAVLYRIKHK